jgi:hypothetical protein
VDSGPAERELGVLTRRYSVLTRAVLAAGCVLLGLIVVPGPRPVPAVTAMMGLLAWIAGYTVRLRRSPSARFVAWNVAVVCLVALGQRWLVADSAAANGTGWVLAVVTITVVALQWHTPVRTGAVATALLVVAYIAGGWLAAGSAELHRLPMVLWVVPYAVLSRGCHQMLVSAGRRSDVLLAERERRRKAFAVSAARRADEREQQALLHDTAAATLLMVGMGTVPGPSSWLADQASRDLLVLQRRAGPAVPIDLADLLAVEVSRSPVPIRHTTAPPRMVLPAPVAEAVAGSVHEALRNIARHAGVERATLRVASDPLQIDIVDAGCGFDPDRVPEHRRGVAESIVARMAAVGGRATVRSAPGRGTLVRLEWRMPDPAMSDPAVSDPAVSDPAVSDPAQALIADRAAEQLRRGMLGVSAAILAFSLPTLVDDAADYRPLWCEALAFAVLAGITALAAVPVLRGRPWGAWRWPLLGAALAAHTAATAAVAPAGLFGQSHWSWEIFGWWAVLLLLDRPVRYLAAVLAIHLGVTVGQVVAAGRADVPTFVGMAIVALVLGGLQVAAWLLGAGIRHAAATAARLAADGERLRTAELVAEQLHHDRQTRYAELSATAGPLLAGLARGQLDPGDAATRLACLIEAARIRRLFAETDDSSDPLVHELTACTDLAARRGVVIELAVRGECPPLPQQVRRGLTEPALLALATAASAARVTVIAIPDRVVVSVVTDGTAPPPDEHARHTGREHVDVVWARQDGTVWMEATWARVPNPGSGMVTSGATASAALGTSAATLGVVGGRPEQTAVTEAAVR